MQNIVDFLCWTPWEYDLKLGFAGLIFGIFWFIVYNTYVIWDINDFRHGHKTIDILPISISQTYYMIEVRWLFQMFMWSSIFSILCIGQNPLYAIVCLLFGIMTCNPSVNSGNIYFIPHMLGAIGAITLALLGLWICYGMWYVPAIAAVSLAVLFITQRKNPSLVYWIEMLSLTLLMWGFGVHLFQLAI